MEQDSNDKKNLPRDVFLHLLAIITLYWSSVAFITLLWEYINYFFRDSLERSYNYFVFSSRIRFGISSLIIIFPVYLGVSFYLDKIYKKETEAKKSKIRRWLIYLTLFIAFLIIIGDLVIVINTFLNGEITKRFILKALSVFLVSCLIFGYYLNDLKEKPLKNLGKLLALLTSFIVFLSVIGGFFIVGSPQVARLIQFDQQKINDLKRIQYQIIYYWQRKKSLPESLSFLNDPMLGFAVPIDPQTGKSYEYSIKDKENLIFELCAVFNKEGNDLSDTNQITRPKEDNFEMWEHPSGYYCFERKIDPNLYPPLYEDK